MCSEKWASSFSSLPYFHLILRAALPNPTSFQKHYQNIIVVLARRVLLGKVLIARPPRTTATRLAELRDRLHCRNGTKIIRKSYL